jgi:sec-independent protein translocase protein TatA
MNIMFAGMLGGWEIVLILVVVLLMFGAKRLPELARGLGQGIKEFKKATRDVTDELNSALDDHPGSNHHYTPPGRPLNEPTQNHNQVSSAASTDTAQTPNSNPKP